jgi:hypothetical protein
VQGLKKWRLAKSTATVSERTPTEATIHKVFSSYHLLSYPPFCLPALANRNLDTDTTAPFSRAEVPHFTPMGTSGARRDANDLILELTCLLQCLACWDCSASSGQLSVINRQLPAAAAVASCQRHALSGHSAGCSCACSVLILGACCVSDMPPAAVQPHNITVMGCQPGRLAQSAAGYLQPAIGW